VRIQNLKGAKEYKILNFLTSGTRLLPSDAGRLREATNHPIQGGNADLIKLAMVKIFNEIAPHYEINCWLQVHDELVFEVKDSQLNDFKTETIKALKGANIYEIGMEIDYELGKTWGDCG
jgi:DNA polymerase-1